MKFRKKPVVIEAWKTKTLIDAALAEFGNLPIPIVEAYKAGNIIFCPSEIKIRTLEGIMSSQPEDMVIRGVSGEFYPCKPDIFEKTYEAVDE